MINRTTILTLAGLLGLSLSALSAETRQLPKPDIRGGMPLMQAIDTRYSERLYDPDHAIDDQTLSDILWAAWGRNSSGKRTIPTARNQQNMGLYLLTKEGTWRYDADACALVKVNDKNLTPSP